MKIEKEIWFSDAPLEAIDVTIGQFIASIENHPDWNEDDKKDYLFDHVGGKAEAFAKKNFKERTKWQTIKSKMMKEFKCQMNLWSKIELRRTLFQGENENVHEFFEKCVSCQYILCDDIIDAVIERDILINFLLGLQKSVYNELTKIDQVMDLQMCLAEAEKYDTNMSDCQVYIKTEDDDKNIKLEPSIEDNYFEEDQDMDFFDDYADNNEEVEESHDEPFEIKPEVRKSSRRNTSANRNLKEDGEISSASDDEENGEKDSDFDYDDHVDKLKYDCKDCGKKYQMKYQLKQHMKNQHGVDENGEKTEMKPVKDSTIMICRHCGVKSNSKKVHILHIKNTHLELCMKCDQPGCPKVWYTNDEAYLLDYHRNVEHGKRDPYQSNLYLCDFCGKPFNLKRLLLHIKKSHYNIRPHLCEQCPKKFVSVSELSKHVQVVHTKGKIYECKMCQKTFDTMAKYGYHNANVHNKQSYVCDVCGKSYPTKLRLDFHSKTHSRSAVTCEICGSNFKREELLLKHKMNVHSEKNLKCDVIGCGASFSTKLSLRVHAKSHQPKEYNFHCPNCPKKFANNIRMQKHIKAIHLGLKELKCDKCDYTCSYKNSLVVHKSSVHEGIMFKCEYCPKEMNRKSNLDVHKKTAHGIPLPGQRKAAEKIIQNEEL